MAHDVMSQFYACLNLPLREKVLQMSRIIDQSGYHKDFQVLFPQLIANIFSPCIQNGWGIRQITFEDNKYEYDILLSFLGPQGSMFKLCYKLLSDPQLKYSIPLNLLPLQLQITLQRGRCPQFYADLLTMDSQTMNIVALALNPFDYYIFNFALHLVNSQNKNWDDWNNVYFALVCDYLMHFLPADPNIPVSPNIPHYTGKVPMVAPLQMAHRPLCSPSLLVISDLSGISNQHSSSQTQSRNEIWRSETILQVFIDIWMNIENFNNRNIEMYQRNYTSLSSSPERVRIVRVLVKHIHSFSAKYNSEHTSLCSFRKYAGQMMCSRAYHYVKHLVTSWPLDASFRLVMELWLSLIQPWRYTCNVLNRERFPSAQRNPEETRTLDESYAQFIAENFPSYTCIFQFVIPRFMRLDLTAYKNAVMLFRLGKVFAQPHLVPMLLNLERAIIDNVSCSPENSMNTSNQDQSYTYNGVALNKWVTIAKQALSELNMTTTFDYDPVWSENKKQFMVDLVKRIIASKHGAEKNIDDCILKINQKSQGVWNSVKNWFMIGEPAEELTMLEEYEKVPDYLNASVNYFTAIFGLNENMLLPFEADLIDDSAERSSFANSNNFTHSLAQKLRKPAGIQYMGDPELMPIMTYENTILVRILYQISTRLNDLYGEEFARLWSRNDLWGYLAREVLQKPTTIQLYVKDASYQQSVVNQELPARLSLRPLGSHVFVIWICFGYVLFKMLSYSGLFYIFAFITVWCLFVLTRASLKIMRIIKN